MCCMQCNTTAAEQEKQKPSVQLVQQVQQRISTTGDQSTPAAGHETTETDLLSAVSGTKGLC